MPGFFGIGDFTRPGKGVSKDAPAKNDLFVYFELIARKFWKFVQLNMLYFITSIPILFVYMVLTGVFITSNWTTVFVGEEYTAAVSADLILRFCLALFMLVIFGNGPFTCGYSYVLRNFSVETHAWIWSDFWEHTRKNIKQGCVLLLINIVFLYTAGTNINIYFNATSSFMTFAGIIFVIMAVIYTMMQFYTFVIITTFKLRLIDVLRNSMLFVLMKPIQNLLLLIFTVSLIVGYLVLIFFSPIATLLAPLLLLSLTSFTFIFYSYRVVKGTMITEKTDDSDTKPTFTDNI